MLEAAEIVRRKVKQRETVGIVAFCDRECGDTDVYFQKFWVLRFLRRHSRADRRALYKVGGLAPDR